MPLPDDTCEALRIERARVDRLIAALINPVRIVNAYPGAAPNELGHSRAELTRAEQDRDTYRRRVGEIADQRDAIAAAAQAVLDEWDATPVTSRTVGVSDAMAHLRNVLDA